MKKPIGFIGAGTVGTALGAKLSEVGYPVAAVADVSREAAERFATFIPEARIFPSAQDLVDATPFVFVTTPDDLISKVVAEISWEDHHQVVHCSGAASLDVLEPARRSGAEVGSFHPCQSFASVEQAIRNLPGTTFAIEASSPLKETLARMAEDMGCSWITLSPGDKALYHAAAVFASNYFVTVVGIAADLFGRFGIEPSRAIDVLMPLLEGTLRNIKNMGLPRCLTGPVARGDLGTVKRHVEALRQRAPEFLRAYAELALKAVPIAVAKGTLSERKARQLEEFLADVLSEKSWKGLCFSQSKSTEGGAG